MTKKSITQRFWEKVTIAPNGCWLWQGTIVNGQYGQFSKNRKKIQAHREAWIQTMGPIPAGACVLHKCDTPSCVNPEHLFLGSQADNMRDMIEKGRGKVGQAKLTKKDVQIIRARAEFFGHTPSEIAQNFPVEAKQVSSIIRRKSWKNI